MTSTADPTTTRTFNQFLGNHLILGGGATTERTTITHAHCDEEAIHISWSDGHVSSFHHLWLRFNCFCRNCGSSDDGIRYIDLTMFPSDIRPRSVVKDESGNLAVVWEDDGHVSEYGPDWLRAYCYSDRERSRRRSFQPKIWKSDFVDHLPRAHYEHIRMCDEERLTAFEHLRDYGFLLIDGVGADPRETERAARLFGPIHVTSNYGYIADVQSQEVSKIGGYTAIHQHPHCDDTFQYAPPGIVLFHFIVNSDEGGGVSTYTDGFAVAESLRQEEPKAFRLLSTVPVQFVRRHAGEFDIRAEGRVICLDDAGKLSGIRYFDRAAAPLDTDEGLVKDMLCAQRKFMQRVIDPAFKMQIKLEPGTVVVVDNHRVMHGRSAFDQRSPRRLRTCTMDREEFHGYWRDLAYRLGREDHDLVLPSGAILG